MHKSSIVNTLRIYLPLQTLYEKNICMKYAYTYKEFTYIYMYKFIIYIYIYMRSTCIHTHTHRISIVQDEMSSRDWLHNNLNVFNTTEGYTKSD